MEFISMNKSGGRLKALDLNGAALFEQSLGNTGIWGTALICTADLDGDGRDEIIVPDGKGIAAFDGNGKKIRDRGFDSAGQDDYGINVPLLGSAKILSPDEPAIIAAVAGGTVAALDKNFDVIWKTEGLRNDFGHEIHFADIDGDGLDEIIFCTADHIGRGVESNVGELVLLDHDGSVMLRKKVSDYINDTHFDDIAMGDFHGNGSSQILLEKGILLDLDGKVIWDISGKFDHGQWIAHTSGPDGNGRICFISELWGAEKRGLLFSGGGEVIKDVTGSLPWVSFDSEEHKELNLKPLPTRCHIIRWDDISEPEIFLSQQAYLPYISGPWTDYHRCYRTTSFGLKALFMDLRGNLTGELPFADAQIEGYFYNGEVHSRVADVDGDGRQEIVFPRQDGAVMIIKKDQAK
jgi:hypothetical protein